MLLGAFKHFIDVKLLLYLQELIRDVVVLGEAIIGALPVTIPVIVLLI